MSDALALARWITHPAWAAHAAAARGAAGSGAPTPAPPGTASLFHTVSVPSDALSVRLDLLSRPGHRVTVDGVPVPDAPSVGGAGSASPIDDHGPGTARSLDLTAHVRDGALRLVVELAPHSGADDEPAVLACVAVHHADGSRERHPTDRAWGARLTPGTSAPAVVVSPPQPSR